MSEGWWIFVAGMVVAFLAALGKFAYKKPDQYYGVATLIIGLCAIAVVWGCGAGWALNEYYDELALLAPENSAYLNKIHEIRAGIMQKLFWMVVGSSAMLIYAGALACLRYLGLVEESSP